MTLLAFTGVLDEKLVVIARAHEISESLVREACVLHRLPTTSFAYWQGWNRLRTKTGCKFHLLFDAVTRVMAQTPRSSSLVENLNSRLRNYFTLRRHLGGSYLSLLRFFLNLHAQPAGRAQRQKPTGINDGPRSSALADVVGPRPTSASAGLTRGGWPPPAQETLQTEIRPSSAGGSSTPCVTQKWQILNHAC